MVVRDFNEDVSSKNIQELIIETGLHKVFSDLSDVEAINRDGAFDNRSKCVNHALGSEGLLSVVEGVELI